MKKRIFPDDWSNLTDEQVLENIKYLQKHFRRYKVGRVCRYNNGASVVYYDENSQAKKLVLDGDCRNSYGISIDNVIIEDRFVEGDYDHDKFHAYGIIINGRAFLTYTCDDKPTKMGDEISKLRCKCEKYTEPWHGLKDSIQDFFEDHLGTIVTIIVLFGAGMIAERCIQKSRAKNEQKNIMDDVKNDSLKNTIEYKEAVEKFNRLSDQQKRLLQKQIEKEFGE